MKMMSITYCGTCNYRPIAARLSRVIEVETGIKPVLIHSPDIGAFEFAVNGELIFSKNLVARFPDFTKIVDAEKMKISSSA
jgi:selT/selW/selH-like putative selenoprotein